MTATALQLGLYALGIFVLFLTPGPVWVALLARTLSGGYRAAWPLAFGVVVGDVIWPLLAILGVAWAVQQVEGFLTILRYGATVIFLIMGLGLLRSAGQPINSDNRLTRKGQWAGFSAGVAVIMSNPKAVLFYMGVLPGFFDLAVVTNWDILAICTISAIVPLLGNLALSGMVHRVRHLLTSPMALRRVNIASGVMLIGVGLILPFI